MYDAIIVGGGPAGLSAALILGRCRRRVLLCDAGNPRNAASHGLHGFLSRDGCAPAELLRIGREQLLAYDVEIRHTTVTDACRNGSLFDLTLEDGTHLFTSKLLLATGIIDKRPTFDGFEKFYGRSVFHCPYCDGWEMRDQALAVYSRGSAALSFSIGLKTWSKDIVLCTDGPCDLSAAERAELAQHGIALQEAPIARLEGSDGVLERIVFKDGKELPRRALFFSLGQEQRSPLAARLGCIVTRETGVATHDLEETNVPGLYVAGDASRDVQLAIVAAAEGVKAAFAINIALQNEERQRTSNRSAHAHGAS